MQRIVIVGASGCGKSHLAALLAKHLGIPAYDLDNYHWLPNWQAGAQQEFICTVQGLIANTRWIICGNYSIVRPMLWQHADTIIWLDYSFCRCFWQALKRSLLRAWYKQACCNGNYESFSRCFFSSHSILLWIIKSYRRRKRDYQALFSTALNQPHTSYFRFNKPQATQNWIDSLLTNHTACKG